MNRFHLSTLGQPIRQIFILWASLLLIGGLALFVAQTPAARAWLWQQTGEEVFAAQVKGVTDLGADLLRPRLDMASDALGDHADLNPFGINVFLEQEVESAKREQAVRMASEAGFRWLRQEFTWEDIEIHGKDDFEDRRHEPYLSAWQKYDHIVELAQQYEMGLIVRLSNPPAWTRAQGDEVGTKAPPDDVEDFADFVRTVVARYQGAVRYYQLWNEPNVYPEWGHYPIDPEAYVALLIAGSEAARAADPDVVIIAGALASTIDLQPAASPGVNNLNDLIFLQRMYDAGAAPYFDIMAMQGYGLYSGPTDRRMHPRVINVSRHHFIRDLMVKNGDAHKPIWLAEMNWNVAPEDVDPRYGRVTLEKQAQYLPELYQQIIDEWPWIGVANTWYLKRATDVWEANKQPEGYFRLLKPDFTPLPVYEHMQEFTQRHRNEK